MLLYLLYLVVEKSLLIYASVLLGRGGGHNLALSYCAGDWNPMYNVIVRIRCIYDGCYWLRRFLENLSVR